MRIALDVDGVLADVIQSWLDYSNSIRPKILKREIVDWEFWRKFKINRYDFYAEMSSCWSNWRSIHPTEQNLALATKNLSKFGQVDIVTARERSTNSYVKQWLNHFDISYDNYVSVIDGTMKADLDYDVFIDDSPLNASRIIQSDKKIILYSQPWNWNFSDTRISRISTLSDVYKHLQEH